MFQQEMCNILAIFSNGKPARTIAKFVPLAISPFSYVNHSLELALMRKISKKVYFMSIE